jgi:DNA-binding transcriptional regulator GbsR (MarR family)
MTDAEKTSSPLSPVAEKFILHWGEMGTRWGINRTVAQIHALLFLSRRPLHAEEIAATLAVARSNVSTSLRELQNWGIVRVAHVLGDRRDHFESMKDVWEMFRVILDERKKRETDPTLHLVRACVAESKKSGDAYERERLADMLAFLEDMTRWYEQTRSMPLPLVKRFVKLGDKVAKMLGLGGG